MTDTMPIIEAPRALREYGLATTYQRLWRAVVAGEVPAERVGKSGTSAPLICRSSLKFLKNNNPNRRRTNADYL